MSTLTSQEREQNIEFNELQQAAIDACCSLKNTIVCGSAGTGKTTIMRTVASRLCRDARIPLLTETCGHPTNPTLVAGTPGIIAVSFTNTAVNNISRALDGVINCVTIHKLLEYIPVLREYVDEVTHEVKVSRVFEPARNKHNQLPASLHTIIIEESGVVSIDLFNALLEAIPNPQRVHFIFLGDLFQIDPPYYPAILGFGLNSDNFIKVELTQVYRQKLNSPILQFAIDIKDRIPVGSNKFAGLCTSGEHGTLEVRPWKHKLDELAATLQAAKYLEKEWIAGSYDENKAMVITPFNVRFGSTELNLLIANFLGKARGAKVFEIITGWEKKYLAVGDAVFVNKRRGVITNIARNTSYVGRQFPQEASTSLDRFGYNNKSGISDLEALEADSSAHDDVDALLMASLATNESRIRSASHAITIMLDSGDEVILDSAGELSISKFDFAYCMTCYKALGSEWDSVYVFAHKSHAVMLSNEFFYTACTRAKKKLVLICEPDHLSKAMLKQSIIGNNWKEKARHFAKNISKLVAFPLVLKLVS